MTFHDNAPLVCIEVMSHRIELVVSAHFICTLLDWLGVIPTFN